MAIYSGPTWGTASSTEGDIIVSNGVQTGLITNDATEQVLYSLVIPAGTMRIGDRINVRSVNEVTALTSGELRQRLWIGPVGGTGLVSGFLAKTSIGRSGWEYNWFGVVDDGSGITSARLAGATFSGIDVPGIDLTVDQTLNFTGQMTIADPGNSFRGLFAFVGR